MNSWHIKSNNENGHGPHPMYILINIKLIRLAIFKMIFCFCHIKGNFLKTFQRITLVSNLLKFELAIILFLQFPSRNLFSNLI